MKYQMVNEKLNIASCSIADLTANQIEAILRCFEDEAKIGTMTLFYDREENCIVLNRDNKDYDMYLDIVTAYLQASGEDRKDFYKKASNSIRETLDVLNKFMWYGFVNKVMFWAAGMNLNDTEERLITGIIESIGNPYGVARYAFKAGVMRGKRIERARRK